MSFQQLTGFITAIILSIVLAGPCYSCWGILPRISQEIKTKSVASFVGKVVGTELIGTTESRVRAKIEVMEIATGKVDKEIYVVGPRIKEKSETGGYLPCPTSPEEPRILEDFLKHGVVLKIYIDQPASKDYEPEVRFGVNMIAAASGE